MTPSYRITGGSPITGTVDCLGAKNFATKAMVAALLTDEVSTLTNFPDIGDVHITADMIRSIGAKLEFNAKEKTLKIDPSTINTHVVSMPQSGSNRIPILMLGGLLNKFTKAEVPLLGGCNIGKRNIDFHFTALEQFGAFIEETPESFMAYCHGPLKGCEITLPYPSVGATETSLFLAVLAKGITVIKNAAIEPEIMELITMLRSMGALIFNAPDRKITIHGVEKLNGTRMEILGDRIDAASWAALACASDGDITVNGISPNILNNFLTHYLMIGGGLELIDNNTIRFFRKTPLKSTIIETDVYPGFSTDWQQPFAILLTQAEGISVIHDTVYEKRFGYLNALNRLGADTQLTTYCLGGSSCRFKDKSHEHSAIIKGETPLVSNDYTIDVPDLRAGLAYVIAAAIAKGTTTITSIHNIERGYGNIVERTRDTNLNIKRIE